MKILAFYHHIFPICVSRHGCEQVLCGFGHTECLPHMKTRYFKGMQCYNQVFRELGKNTTCLPKGTQGLPGASVDNPQCTSSMKMLRMLIVTAHTSKLFKVNDENMFRAFC